jgi:hypothetical protein
MHPHRLSLLFVAALLSACGGARSAPGGSGAGTGGAAEATGGTGGTPATGGSGGPGDNGGAGGTAAAGAGGAPMGASGGSGAGGSGAGGSGAGAADAAADSLPQNDVAADTSAAVDTAAADSADVGPPGIDFDAGSATCGGATCPRLFPRVEGCNPSGACTQQTDGLVIRRCYANGVRIVGTVNPLTASIVGRYFNGGAECFAAEAPLVVAPGQTVVFRDPQGAEIGRAGQGPGTTTALTCDGQTFNLADRSCLPAFTESDCLPGVCL